MAHLTSKVASFKIDSTSVLTDISGSVNNVTVTGGNSLVQDTGLGDSRHTEILDVDPIMEIGATFMVNSTTEAIFGPCLDGTAVAKTVEVRLITGKFFSGEANVGAVSFSVPIGLQTGTVTLRSSDTTGFSRTSVAL